MREGPGYLESNQFPVKPALDTISKIISQTPAPPSMDNFQKLQTELESFLPNTQIQTFPDGQFNWDEIFKKSSGELHNILVNLSETLKQKTSLGDHLDFGAILQKEFELFQQSKELSEIPKSSKWETFIKRFISPTQDRRYRSIYKLLKNHRKFYSLNCSFDFILKRKRLIEIFLTTNYQQFWR